MEDLFLGRPALETILTVKNPEQAKLLSDKKSLRYFEPFLARERSVKQAATEVGCNLDTMLYRVGTFQDLDLLRVTNEIKRKGRAIKLYRSTADAYKIPFTVTPYADVEEALAESSLERFKPFIRGQAKALRENNSLGRIFFRDAETAEVWQVSDNSIEDWRAFTQGKLTIADILTDDLDLTKDEAVELLLELYRLYKGKKILSKKGQTKSAIRKKYAFQFALVEIDKEDVS